MADERRLLDEIAAAATVAPLDDDLGGWRCKASPDVPFRRANAVLPPIGATAERERFDADLARVRQWYARLGQRLIVQVSEADPEVATLDAWLAEAGLVVEAPVHLLVARSLDRFAEVPVDGALLRSVHVGVDEPWAEAEGTLVDGDRTHRARSAAYGRTFSGLGEAAIGVAVRRDRATVGVGLGVIDRGWLGVFAMATSAARRRQGIASHVLAGLAEGGLAAGATAAYLQVETDNAPALALYERHGFERSHGYHYRSAGLDEAIGC